MSADEIVLRDAVPADLAAIVDIVSRGPDAAADWTYPRWREQAAETAPLFVAGFAPLLRSRAQHLRVAERDGQVIGYCGWMRRDMVDGEVKTVHLTEPCDEQALDAECLRLTGPDELPKFRDVLAINAARSAANKALREAQTPEPCLAVACYQLFVMGVDETQQGRGVGGRLIREGLARATDAGLPVFVTGEGRGMRVYQHLGFEVLAGAWWGFDEEGKEVKSKEEVGEHGLEAAQMVWVPEGRTVVVKGVEYHGTTPEAK